MRAQLLSLMLLPLFAAACTQQSDAEKICNAEAKFLTADEKANIPPEDQLTVAVSRAAQSVKTEDGRHVLDALAVINPAKKGEALRDFARKHGVNHCPSADRLDQLTGVISANDPK